jgi:hypothetical protein
MQNDLQWPQIGTFIHHIHWVVKNYLDRTCVSAASIIQHHVRLWLRKEKWHTPLMATQRFRNMQKSNGNPCTRSQMSSFFENSPAVAHIKLDGTNVGIDLSGSLFGRRMKVDDSSTSYQSTDIRFLRSTPGLSVAHYFAHFFEHADFLNKLQFRVYGELVCNNLHGYSKQEGLYKSWRCFGAIADASKLSREDRVSAAARLVEAGFALKINLSSDASAAEENEGGGEEEGGGGECSRIVLYANDALRKALAFDLVAVNREKDGESHGKPTKTTTTTTKPTTTQGKGNAAAAAAAAAAAPAAATHSPSADWFVSELNRGSLAEVVAKSFSWMHGIQGEGVVITHTWSSPRQATPRRATVRGGGRAEIGGGGVGGDVKGGAGGERGAAESDVGGGGGGFAMAHKWKCACEPQGKNPALMADLLEHVSTLEKAGLDFLLPASLKDMLTSLAQVATAKPPPAAVAQKKKSAKQKPADGGDGVGDGGGAEGELKARIEDAIASAATKFDSLEAYFSKGAKAEIVTLLVAEVVADLRPPPPTPPTLEAAEGPQKEKAAGGVSLDRAVPALVNRYVGIAFGKYLNNKKAEK